ncbi:MAG: prolipoprotein diacylglyceryl transferase [Anaerolineae bacterium]|jgi:phosphatidylglycerol:prolipoprotein diacylglycerol transferase|nr:prolipoprotein diacylglyceryl transferase [Anaerolineae bacterium]
MMPYTTLGPFTLPTYTLLLMIAIGVSLARLAYGQPRLIDAGLAGLAGGLIGGRIVHVLLQWSYFSAHPTEITQFNTGGLAWHGAVIGALIGIAIVARLRRIAWRDLTDRLALIVPWIGLMAWWGCRENSCSYGIEIANLSAYPSYLVWEAKDIYGLIAPRYNTQNLGMAFAIALMMILIALTLTGRLYGRRFGIALISWGVIMGMLGFLRGDQVLLLNGWRADQGLDLLMIAFGFWSLIPMKETTHV